MLAYDAVAGIEEFEKLNRVIMEANPEIDVPIEAQIPDQM